MTQRDRIQGVQFEAGTDRQHDRLAGRVQRLDVQVGVADRFPQNEVLQPQAIVPQQRLAADQPDMQVDVDQPSAWRVVADITRRRRMVTRPDCRKELEAEGEQDAGRPVLI